MDAIIFKGKSFKVGWLKGFKFTSVSTPLKSIDEEYGLISITDIWEHDNNEHFEV